MTTIRSATPATTPRSWVMSRMAAPVASWARSRTPRIWAWMVTSRAVVGSSATSTSGSLAMAMAIMARWRMPPLNSCGYWRARAAALGMPTRSSSSAARAIAAFRSVPGWWASMASAIWKPTLRTGLSDVIGSWKIIASFPPRNRRSSGSGRPSSSSPRKRTDPVTVALRGSRPITASMLTDFPDPDSPTMPSDSPSETMRSSPRTACTAPSGDAKVTWRSLTSRTGAATFRPGPGSAAGRRRRAARPPRS